jgi:hypothetical protein
MYLVQLPGCVEIVCTNRQRNTSSIGDMLQDLNWCSLKDGRKDFRLVMMYKSSKRKLLLNKTNLRCVGYITLPFSMYLVQLPGCVEIVCKKSCARSLVILSRVYFMFYLCCLKLTFSPYSSFSQFRVTPLRKV